MAQWDVYENPSPRVRAEIPYLLDIQSGMLSGLRTRFVVPLAAQAVQPVGLPRRLIPIFEIGGRSLRLVPHEAGVIDATLLRKPVATLRDERSRITDAMDAVISGV
jgi:toxin CcdB